MIVMATGVLLVYSVAVMANLLVAYTLTCLSETPMSHIFSTHMTQYSVIPEDLMFVSKLIGELLS